ncbi:MAG: hypothetical protein U1D67_00020 [Dehalococcoidia bacterium]|nr:hypothetical protein [Dehalococcoidia bacterium]
MFKVCGEEGVEAGMVVGADSVDEGALVSVGCSISGSCITV